MSSVRLLLPTLVVVERLGGSELRLLRARGDRLEDGTAGRAAASLRAFTLTPAKPFAVAALTRQAQVGDARDGVWLRADPGYAQADLATLRLLRCGDLDLSAPEAAALVRDLKPLFGDAGYELSAPSPSRWYLRGITSAEIPNSPDPADILGDDLHAHIPTGVQGAKWRRLLNDAQVLLHQHEVNRVRAARGAVTANTLWFWGGGALPHAVQTTFARVVTEDEVLLALARGAGIVPVSHSDYAPATAVDAAALVVEAWTPAVFKWLVETVVAALVSDLRRGRIAAIELDCMSGERWRISRWQLWRFWRRAT